MVFSLLNGLTLSVFLFLCVFVTVYINLHSFYMNRQQTSLLPATVARTAWWNVITTYNYYNDGSNGSSSNNANRHKKMPCTFEFFTKLACHRIHRHYTPFPKSSTLVFFSRASSAEIHREEKKNVVCVLNIKNRTHKLNLDGNSAFKRKQTICYTRRLMKKQNKIHICKSKQLRIWCVFMLLVFFSLAVVVLVLAAIVLMSFKM